MTKVPAEFLLLTVYRVLRFRAWNLSSEIQSLKPSATFLISQIYWYTSLMSKPWATSCALLCTFKCSSLLSYPPSHPGSFFFFFFFFFFFCCPLQGGSSVAGSPCVDTSVIENVLLCFVVASSFLPLVPREGCASWLSLSLEISWIFTIITKYYCKFIMSQK